MATFSNFWNFWQFFATFCQLFAAFGNFLQLWPTFANVVVSLLEARVPIRKKYWSPFQNPEVFQTSGHSTDIKKLNLSSNLFDLEMSKSLVSSGSALHMGTFSVLGASFLFKVPIFTNSGLRTC